MAMNILTNTFSLNAQRSLAASQNSLGRTIGRLSSGMRINSASDDAAGLAISSGLSAQINGLNQSVRNANDGLSLLGTAESAMGKQVTLLQRMRVLSVQASSDTNSASDRQALNSEVTQLKNELDRISVTTKFNGIALLDGTFTSKSIQVGAFTGVNDKIGVDVLSTRAADLGSAYKEVGTSNVTANAWNLGEVSVTANGTTTLIDPATDDGVSNADGADSALAKANAFNAQSGSTGVTATASTSHTGNAAQTGGGNAVDAGDLKINGVDVGAFDNTTADSTAAVDAINAIKDQTGVTATLDTGTNKIVLSATDGRNIEINADADAAAATGFDSGTNVRYGKITLRSTGSFTVTDNSTGQTTGLDAGANVATQSTTENVNALDISSKAGADLAVEIIDTAISNINTRMGAIGAQTNRLQTAIENMRAMSENFSAANSRIMDADFALETAELTKTQILVQAGVAMLSQANQVPQQALSLLR